MPYTTWLQQQLLNESFGANIHVHPSAVPMAPGLAPQMVPMQPFGWMSPHPMHMPVGPVPQAGVPQMSPHPMQMPAGPVPQAGVQQQETVPTPPWRADTNASFLAATSAPVAAAHGVGQGATPADAAAAELPKSDDKSWWWDGKRYPPLVSRFWCQTRQRIRQVQCVQEDMFRLQDFHVEDRTGETLQRPTVFQERWQRHWC